MADDIIRWNSGRLWNSGQRWNEPPVMPLPAAPPRPIQAKGKHVDYIPSKRSDRYLWYRNLSDNAVAEAVKVGAPAADGTALKASADAILARMDATADAENALDGARSAERSTEAAQVAAIRARVRNWKTLPGYGASGTEGVLQLKGGEVAFDPATFKAVLKASVEAGHVKIDFFKRGVDGLAIYMRLRGQTQWRRIGTDTEPPYFDTTPLTQAGVPEVREYMARGLIADDEVGVDSDIVSVTFAG